MTLHDRMMRPLKKEMDINKKMPILVLLMIYINGVSGMNLSPPDNLVVEICDGEVTVLWDKPVDAPSNVQYNVRFGKHNGEYAMVDTCTKITKSFCNLSKLIHDYGAAYKVQVQLVIGDHMSAWTPKKKILPTSSELLPPSFTLLATSTTLRVYVHQKPILKKIYKFGVTYTIFLEEKGQNTNVVSYLKDDTDEDQTTQTFSPLHWGKEYCVTVKVEGNGGLTSSQSSQQCVVLPEQEWIIIAVSSLSVLGVFIIIAIVGVSLLCFLKRPAKTPVALKCLVSGWNPLSVREGTMEVVTDKGWFLSSYRAEVKQCDAKESPSLHVEITDEDGDEDRRTSTDSGVSINSTSDTNEECPPMRQEDSGCGSLVGQESSGSQTEYPLQDERTDTDPTRKRVDSGVGFGCQLDSSSINLDGQDSGLLKECVVGCNYRTQRPSDVQISVCDDEQMFKQMPPESELADVVTGYRAIPQLCTCSGAGHCSWCHNCVHFGAEVVKQYKSVCINNELLNNKCNIMDSFRGKLYSTKGQMDTVIMGETDASSNMTFVQLEETFPLLTALSSLPLVEGEQDFNMNNVPLSLCDVELTND
ncbi:interleukin-10 receptor subunit alpha [Sphaeramia orbicularis]|uniref:Uncharacterized LOC115431026 n=1 Tax=Sphaeramia orbicularis TaxID=375764 RepID=A0A673B080_9TELE|nr:uncharacterized protein LOC115431026 [Sphaeramia orbicularis]